MAFLPHDILKYLRISNNIMDKNFLFPWMKIEQGLAKKPGLTREREFSKSYMTYKEVRKMTQVSLKGRVAIITGGEEV
jgi:hypothetical protein